MHAIRIIGVLFATLLVLQMLYRLPRSKGLGIRGRLRILAAFPDRGEIVVAENPLITALRDQRDAAQNELDTLLKAPTAEKRNLNEAEQASFDEKRDAIKGYDDRIVELVDLDQRKSDAAEARKAIGWTVTNEPNPVYRRDAGVGDASFFADLAAAGLNWRTAPEARDRLAKSQETRAADMTTGAGAGGEFAPPLWQVEDFISYARAGRVTADLCQQNVLPSGVSSINLPKVSGPSSTAVQQTQGNAVSDTAMTTTSVSSGITTIAGKQVVSMQLLQQSGIPFDKVILQDLAADYAVQLDKQVVYGSGSGGQVLGLVNSSVSGTANAFTSATPAPASVTNANSLYYTVSKAEAALWTAIFQPADAIVMHPRRWAWILGSVDVNSRPFIVPRGMQFNGVGLAQTTTPAQGYAGAFGDLDVYVDPNISITANSATNQDEIYILKRSELWLYETPVQSASFDATYADSASILFRVLGYMGLIANRRSGAVQVIRGTGLVAP